MEILVLFLIFADIVGILYYIIKKKLIRNQIRNRRMEEAYKEAQEYLTDLEEMVRRRRAYIDEEIREA